MPEKKILNIISSPVSEGKYIFYLLGLLVFFVATITSFFPIDNYDIWWHMKTGEYIISEKSIPEYDIYSFTAEGKPWITHEWLAELIFFGIYSLGGINLLIIIKVLISLLIPVILLRYAYKNGNRNFLIFIVLGAAVCIGSFRMFVRPHLFTYLFLTVTGMTLFDPAFFDKGKITKLMVVPVLFLLWANLHSGFILGLGVFWIIAIVAFIKNRFEKSRTTYSQSLKKYVLPPAVASLAALINPNGINAFRYPFLLASEPVFKKAIAEMVSPFEIFSTEKLYWLLLVIIIGFAVYGLLLNIKRRPAISIVLLIGVISSLMSIRNAYEFALLTAVASIVSFPKYFRSVGKLGYLAAIIFILCAGYFTSNYIDDLRGHKLGVTADVPYGAVNFLERADYNGNIYAPLGWGGYLIWRDWPALRVFIDGRLLVYGPDLLNKYHYIRLNNPQALDILKVSGTDAVAVPIGKQLWPVRRALDESPEWQICFFDDKSVIFLMKNERNREWLEKWGLTKIDPLVTGYIKSEARQADSTIIMEEALRAHEQSPDAVTTNAVLARAYFLDSEFIKAAEHYKKAFLLGPALTDFIYQVATSYNRGGEPDSAAVWYEKAIQARSADERSYLEYGVMEAKRGRYAKALEIWKRILKINPRSRARDYIEQMENIMDKAKADSG